MYVHLHRSEHAHILYIPTGEKITPFKRSHLTWCSDKSLLVGCSGGWRTVERLKSAWTLSHRASHTKQALRVWLRDTRSWLPFPAPHTLHMAAIPAVEAGGWRWRASGTFTILCVQRFSLVPEHLQYCVSRVPEHLHLLGRSLNSQQPMMVANWRPVAWQPHQSCSAL